MEIMYNVYMYAITHIYLFLAIYLHIVTGIDQGLSASSAASFII